MGFAAHLFFDHMPTTDSLQHALEARLAQVEPDVELLACERVGTERLRLFPDAGGVMNEPLGEREVLCVSQFTLYGDARKGNRPSYVDAAPPEEAEPLYERVRESLGAQGGRFGQRMAVELVNDGPVTILVEV